MRINNNISAMNTYSRLTSAQSAQGKSLEKLSSGLRINRAGDDAAGLAISEKMRGQIKGLNQSVRNAQDGISLIQTAEGALNETHSILNRMRELAVQSSNDTNTDDDRVEIQKEMNQLAEEITRIGNDTQFNTKELLNGDVTSMKFHIGANKSQNMELKISDMRASALGVEGAAGFSRELTQVGSVTTKYANAAIAINVSEDAAAGNHSATTNTKAVKLQDTLTHGGNNYNYALVNDNDEVVALSTDGEAYTFLGAATAEKDLTSSTTLTDAKVTFTNAKVTQGTVTITTTNDDDVAVELKTISAVASDATVQLSEDSGLKSGTYTVVGTEHASVAAATGSAHGLADSEGNIVALSADGEAWTSFSDSGKPLFTLNTASKLTSGEITISGNGGIDVSSQVSADAAIKTIDDAITAVSAERSKLGAVQNRLDHTINNLTTTSENLSAAESRIRDVDMAKEMMEFTKNNILNQASTAMLAQANQMPQGVLQLLG